MEKMVALKDQVTDLKILDEDHEIDGDLAWNIAQFINDMDNDIRLAKGKFWNRCKHGTREEICDHFDWPYGSMARHARFAKDVNFFPNGKISFSATHSRILTDSRITDDDRFSWLQKATDNEWTPKQLSDAIAEERRQTVKEILEERKGESVPDDQSEAEMRTQLKEENIRQTRESFREDRGGVGRRPSTSISITQACEFLGLSTLTWITQDTLDILYKGYAKRMHSDTGNGTDEEMAMLNRCKEKLQTIVR